MNKIRITLMLLSLVVTNASIANTDSIELEPMTKFTPAFRVGAGLTHRLYFETGVALHKFRSNPPNSISHNIYSAIEATSTMYGDRGFLLLAPKIGYQLHLIFYAIGVEAKYLSDGKNKDAVIALKAGFSILGVIDLMYGYQASFNGYPFPNVGAHQLGLAFTIYRKSIKGEKI